LRSERRRRANSLRRSCRLALEERERCGGVARRATLL
jgi:hypothetical protein